MAKTTHTWTCAAWREGRRRCFARVEGGFCAMHDPALAARRAAAGRVRHVRFKVDERAPTLAYVMNRALDIADACHGAEPGEDVKRFDTELRALSLVRGCLDAQYERGKARSEDDGGADGVAKPVPPWMQPEPTQ